LKHNKKTCYGGYFDNEEQAAMSVNLLCDKIGKERKNPMIDIGTDAMKKQFQNQTSQYNGVCWNNNEKKWHAKLKHNKKTCYGGYFDNEEQAAMSVNLLCDKIGIERKNPNVIMEPEEIQHQFQNQTSQYNGVCWNKDKKKWQAKLKHNKKTCSGGYFDNEEEAAMSINLLCDKIGKERKNPNVIMEPDVNKEIKVEEESILGGFKHKCEDRFMQDNEESCITSASCESKKRNRKEELTNYE